MMALNLSANVASEHVLCQIIGPMKRNISAVSFPVNPVNPVKKISDDQEALNGALEKYRVDA
ncbi:hypothetical protein D1AOALGA4SA_2562 [Olavius algarvensis Delta 1 endosymbiont]|nr:hypothetical protein D1AOALGA4SA_2562 [Olavius algarvensis Delta 1 endosymbiont]